MTVTLGGRGLDIIDISGQLGTGHDIWRGGGGGGEREREGGKEGGWIAYTITMMLIFHFPPNIIDRVPHTSDVN